MADVKKVITIEVNDDAAVKSVDNLNDSLNNTSKSSSNASAGISEIGKTVDGVTGGAISKFKALTSTLGSVAGGFKTVGLAIAATGLGALLIAIIAVKQAFTSSEAGQNKWTQITETLGIIVGKVTDVIANLGDAIIKVGSKIGSGLATAAKYTAKFFDTITFGAFGAEKALNKTAAAYDKVAKQAEENANRIAKADKLEREIIVNRANSDKKRQELLEKSENRQKYSQKERIEFLKQASSEEEKITNQEIKLAKLRLANAEADNSKSKSDKDALKNVAELTANVTNLETARLSKQKEITAKVSGLVESEAATYKAAQDSKTAANKARIDAELAAERARIINIQNLENELGASIEQAETDYYNSKLTKRQLEEQEVGDYYFNLIEQAKLYELDVKILEKAKTDKLAAIKTEYELKEADRAKQQQELLQQIKLSGDELELYNLDQSYIAKFELAKGNADLLEALEKEKADKIDKIREDAAQKETDREAQLQAQKEQGVRDGLTVISNLAEIFAGQSLKRQKAAFKVQKAVNIANATIDTYKAATGAFSSLSAIPIVGPILGGLAAAAAITAGIINVKKIASTQFEGGSTPSAGSASASFGAVASATTAAASSTPNFNVVGDTGVNQLDNLKTPIKAFVVGSEVTSQQQLDRNKIATATL